MSAEGDVPFGIFIDRKNRPGKRILCNGIVNRDFRKKEKEGSFDESLKSVSIDP